MGLLQCATLPTVVYLLGVGGLWLGATALVVAGSSLPGADAMMARTAVGVGMAYTPVNPWAVGVPVAGVGFLGLSSWRRREAVWPASCGRGGAEGRCQKGGACALRSGMGGCRWSNPTRESDQTGG